MKVDFPALGLPSTATFLPSGKLITMSGTLSSRVDFKRFKFKECSALISIYSVMPFSDRSSIIDDSDFLSI